MTSLVPVRILYVLAAAYDGLLGLGFIVAAPRLFEYAAIPPPNHWGYIHFPAGLLVIFALIFLAIARDPVGSRNLVIYGVLLKVCYVTTVVWYDLHGGIPVMWNYFAVADALFGMMFIWSFAPIRKAATARRAS
jgi:hypothetical protein